MKRLICFSALFLSLIIYQASAQFSPPGPIFGHGFTPVSGGGGGPPGTCSQATAFLARNGGANSAATTTLICGMVTDGTFALLDALYIFATDTTAHASLNLISTNYTLIPHGTLTFTANTGWAGDGSTGYADTQFNPATAVSSKYSLNSGSLGLYDRSTPGAGSVMGMGASDATEFSTIFYGGTGATVGDINSNNFPNLGNLAAGNQGAITLTRNGSTINSYWNGNPTAIGASNEASVGLVNQNIFVFAANWPGPSSSPSLFTTDQLSAAWIGAGLTGIQAATIENRINNYLITLGKNVYPFQEVVNWVADGDSITVGAGGVPAYPFVALASMPGGTPSTPGTNTPANSVITNVGYVGLNDIAVIGTQFSVMNANFATVVAPLVTPGAVNMLTVMAGTNDAANGASAATIYSLLKTYVGLARAAGYTKIVVGTITARDDDGGTLWTNVLAPYNALVRANYNTDIGADALMDFGASPLFSPASAALNLTNYTSDHLHPNTTGEAGMGAIAEPPILALLP